MPIDPISLGSAALQGLTGIAQAIGGGIRAHRGEKQFEKLINSYQPNQSIMDYYTKALARYNVNPYTSSLYNNAMRGAGRGLTTGINTLNDRRSVLGGITRLTQGYDDASLKAAAAAEGQQSQALSQLGQAAGMKTAEEKYPFELKANMLAAKASGGTQTFNAGLSNIFGSSQSLSQMAMLKQMYGDDFGTTGTRTSYSNPNVGINTTDAIRRYSRR